MPQPRIIKRSLAFYLAFFLTIFFMIDMLVIHYSTPSDKRYSEATTNLLTTSSKYSNMELSVLPNQNTVVLEPSPDITCHDYGDGLFTLFIVISAPKNVQRRRLIRSSFRKMQSSWEEQFFHMKTKSNARGMNVSRVFQLLFFVGQSAEHGISEEVREEWERHGDVIVDDMQESYLRLTVKTLRMLKWVLHNCANAKYLVKLDDDVFVNVPKLFSFLLYQPDGYNPLLIAGRTFDDAAPNRDPASKWFTPTSLWSRDRFPKFIAGFCYVLGLKVAQELFEESRNAPMIHLEDVFLTGIVGSDRLHHKLTHIGGVVSLLHMYHNLYTSEWAVQQLVIHQVSPRQFQRWIKLTTGVTNSSIKVL